MEGKVSDYQRWDAVTVHRSELKNAPYNPRKLPAKARAKLKANIARVGLLEPPVWNRKTGNIVGGHQRVSVLDSLHKSADYSLTVAAVELDDKEERQQNVFLNNGEAQGEWDLDKLDELFKGGIGVDASGFDPASVLRMFGCVPGQAENSSADDLERIAGAVEAAKKVRGQLSKKSGDPFSDDSHYYLVLVGGNDAQRVAVTTTLKLEDNRYQDLRIIGRLVALARSLGASETDLEEWAAGVNDELVPSELIDPERASALYSTSAREMTEVGTVPGDQEQESVPITPSGSPKSNTTVLPRTHPALGSSPPPTTQPEPPERNPRDRRRPRRPSKE